MSADTWQASGHDDAIWPPAGFVGEGHTADRGQRAMSGAVPPAGLQHDHTDRSFRKAARGGKPRGARTNHDDIRIHSVSISAQRICRNLLDGC